MTGATLVVAKIDRLARNLRFLLIVVEGCGEGGVMFCDLPALPAGPVGEFMLNQMAAVAALEAGLISERTKAALTAARARGIKLGGWRGGPKVSSAIGVEARQKKADTFAASVGPIASALQSQGQTLHQIAAELTERDIRTPHDRHWNATGVRNLLARVDEIARRPIALRYLIPSSPVRDISQTIRRRPRHGGVSKYYFFNEQNGCRSGILQAQLSPTSCRLHPLCIAHPE
jgi:hypothetical protein